MNDTVPYNQPSNTPTPKVTAMGIGGSATVVLVFLLKSVFNLEIPAEVAAALTTLIGVMSGYMTRDKKPIRAVQEIIRSGGLKG